MVQSPKWKNLEKPFRKPRQQSSRNDGKTKDIILICKHTTCKHKSRESHSRKAKNEKSRKTYEITYEPLHGPTPKREKKQNPRGRTTESERYGGQREDAAFQEEPPAGHSGPCTKTKPKPDQGAGVRGAGHDRRSGPQKPGSPSPITETDRKKSRKA